MRKDKFCAKDGMLTWPRICTHYQFPNISIHSSTWGGLSNWSLWIIPINGYIWSNFTKPTLHNHMLNTTTINCVSYSACFLMERQSLTQHHRQSVSVLLCISPLGVEGGSAMVLENIWIGIKVWTQNKHKSKTQNKHESNQGGGWIGWCWNTY